MQSTLGLGGSLHCCKLFDFTLADNLRYLQVSILFPVQSKQFLVWFDWRVRFMQSTLGLGGSLHCCKLFDFTLADNLRYLQVSILFPVQSKQFLVWFDWRVRFVQSTLGLGGSLHCCKLFDFTLAGNLRYYASINTLPSAVETILGVVQVR